MKIASKMERCLQQSVHSNFIPNFFIIYEIYSLFPYKNLFISLIFCRHGRRVLQSTVLHLESQLREKLDLRNWETLQDALESRLMQDCAEEERYQLLSSPLAAKLLPLLNLVEADYQEQQQQPVLAASMKESCAQHAISESMQKELDASSGQQSSAGVNKVAMDYSTALVLSAAWLASSRATPTHINVSNYFSVGKASLHFMMCD